jgi:FRG domain
MVPVAQRRAKGASRHTVASRIKEIRVRSWEELNRELYENTWNEQIRRFRSDYVYRGLAHPDWSLTTSLHRLGGNYRELESHLLRNFRKYARQDPLRDSSEWNWLSLAQHHGLPTRLLDWTYSPYVALHFATERLERHGCDGVVWCVNYVEAHRSLPRGLQNRLRRERSNAFTVEMLSDTVRDLRALERLSKRDYILFLEPPSFDERIVNQYSLFSMMSSPEAQPGEWFADQRSQLLRRIIIPAELKWEVRDKLDQANITERVLYPGLDGLSRWLRRHYMPRPEDDAVPISPDKMRE